MGSCSARPSSSSKASLASLPSSPTSYCDTTAAAVWATSPLPSPSERATPAAAAAIYHDHQAPHGGSSAPPGNPQPPGLLLLRPEFEAGLQELERLVVAKATPKALCGRAATGSMIAALASIYVKAMNAGILYRPGRRLRDYRV